MATAKHFDKRARSASPKTIDSVKVSPAIKEPSVTKNADLEPQPVETTTTRRRMKSLHTLYDKGKTYISEHEHKVSQTKKELDAAIEAKRPD